MSIDLRTEVSLLTISIALAEHFYAILIVISKICNLDVNTMRGPKSVRRLLLPSKIFTVVMLLLLLICFYGVALTIA